MSGGGRGGEGAEDQLPTIALTLKPIDSNLVPSHRLYPSTLVLYLDSRGFFQHS